MRRHQVIHHEFLVLCHDGAPEVAHEGASVHRERCEGRQHHVPASVGRADLLIGCVNLFTVHAHTFVIAEDFGAVGALELWAGLQHPVHVVQVSLWILLSEV